MYADEFLALSFLDSFFRMKIRDVMEVFDDSDKGQPHPRSLDAGSRARESTEPTLPSLEFGRGGC